MNNFLLSSSEFKSFKTPIAIVGMGITGRSVFRLLQLLQIDKKDILTFDYKDPLAQVHSAQELMAHKPRTLIVSPGVPLSSPWICEAKAHGIQISNELTLSFSFLTTEKVIGITGSVGKSTTTSLLGAAAHSFSPDCFVGGNLGTPLAEYICDLLASKRAKAPWVILELSSYQLENFPNLKCDLAALTYLTPNHMERYENLQAYYRVKLALKQKTQGLFVINANGGDLAKMRDQFNDKNSFWADRNSSILKEKNILNPALSGDYNLDNIAVAATLTKAAGWPEAAYDALKNFTELTHRLQRIGEFSGISFINDSKATTIESVLQAAQTISKQVSNGASLFLLLGGHDKGLPWERLSVLSQNNQIQPIFFGEFGAQAKKITQLQGPVYNTLKLALLALPSLVKKSDVVLLSPGGTSHDEFKNFEQRGDFFKSEVLRLFNK